MRIFASTFQLEFISVTDQLYSRVLYTSLRRPNTQILSAFITNNLYSIVLDKLKLNALIKLT